MDPGEIRRRGGFCVGGWLGDVTWCLVGFGATRETSYAEMPRCLETLPCATSALLRCAFTSHNWTHQRKVDGGLSCRMVNTRPRAEHPTATRQDVGRRPARRFDATCLAPPRAQSSRARHGLLGPDVPGEATCPPEPVHDGALRRTGRRRCAQLAADAARGARGEAQGRHAARRRVDA